MAYHYLDYEQLHKFCAAAFRSYGFDEKDAGEITDILLAADLNGIESHGVQRMVRYDYEIASGMVDMSSKPEIVYETPMSAVIDAHNGMGQVVGRMAMQIAIEKAKKVGCGMVSVRRSNHYGIAGYYTEMAAKEDLMGLCMTNTEAIMVPTYGKQPMIGTNPIALAMPADPIPSPSTAPPPSCRAASSRYSPSAAIPCRWAGAWMRTARIPPTRRASFPTSSPRSAAVFCPWAAPAS